MQSEVDQLQIRPDDGFRHPEDKDSAEYVSWQQSHTATVHYLHGALHLFDAQSEMIKFTWSRTDIPIVDQIRRALDEGRYPLFVAEGTTESKHEKILHNAYLHKAFRSLEGCCDSPSNAIVLFGHSLADNDRHVLRLISGGKARHVLISLFGPEGAPNNREIIERANQMVAHRDAVAGRYPLDVIFYDAQSARVWG